MYLLYDQFFCDLLLNDSPSFYFSCVNVYFLWRYNLKRNLIHWFWNDVICWKVIFTFLFCQCFLFQMSEVFTLFNNCFSMCSLKTWFLWSYCLAFHLSILLYGIFSGKIFFLWGRTWSISKVWYFPLLLMIKPWPQGIMCLKSWLGELFLGKVKGVFSQLLWKCEYFWHWIPSKWVDVNWWFSYTFIFAIKSFNDFGSKFCLENFLIDFLQGKSIRFSLMALI